MNDQPLLATLRAAAQAEADAITAAARARAERLLAAAEARTGRHGDQVLAAHREALDAERAAAVEGARAATSRATLVARHGFVDRVFARTRALGPDRLRGPEAAAWVARTITEAVGFLPDGGARLAVTDPAWLAHAREADPARDWVVEPLRDSSGIILTSGDGGVRVEATVERFLDAERSRLAQWLARRVEAGT